MNTTNVIGQSAVGYVRVSTAEQGEDGSSLPMQEGRIRAYCEMMGYRLDDVVVEIMSGKDMGNRPKLREALDKVCAIKGALVVYSLSRMARNTRQTLEIADRLEKCGADLVSLTEKIDTTSAAGKMVFRVLAVLAEFERDVISERTKSVLHDCMKKGRALGQRPYGYRKDEQTGMLSEDAEEMRAVNRILNLRRLGMSLNQIAQVMSEEHWMRRNGNDFWATQTVSNIIDWHTNRKPEILGPRAVIAEPPGGFPQRGNPKTQPPRIPKSAYTFAELNPETREPLPGGRTGEAVAG